MTKFTLILILILLFACNNGTGTIETLVQSSPAPGCTVTQTTTNTIISCPDGTTANIPSLIEPISPVGIITPCGAASSPWKEVIICLSNGGLLSSFSETMSGQDTRLSIIPDGNYIDTDESGCNFTVSTTPTVRNVSWNSGSNQYSAWPAETDQCVINQ